MTPQPSKSRFVPTCMAYHAERRVFCALPCPDGPHEGPHGWDYEAGDAAVIKRSDYEAHLRASGQDALADRLPFALGEVDDY